MSNRNQNVGKLTVTGSVEQALERGSDLPTWIVADLRSDHAGEAGAVCIYRGILMFAKDPSLIAFAKTHMVTEQRHLREIESWLPKGSCSRLLPVWRLAGYVTGALPALFGPKAVYATIEAVENFVDQHYDEQVQALADHQPFAALRQALLECQRDEVVHRDEAAAAVGPGPSGWVLRVWCALVGAGSKAAVALIRRI